MKNVKDPAAASVNGWEVLNGKTVCADTYRLIQKSWRDGNSKKGCFSSQLFKAHRRSS